VPAKHAERGLLTHVQVAPFPFPVEETLDIGEKRNELAVMPFLELAGVPRKFIHHLTPGIIAVRSLQQFPMLLDRRILINGHELDRPEKDLPKVPDDRVGVRQGATPPGTRAMSSS
jgi:hypothetical protein